MRKTVRQRSFSTSSNETPEKRRWRRHAGHTGSGDNSSEKQGVRGWLRKEIGELFHTDAVIGDATDPKGGPANDFFMEQHEEDLRYSRAASLCPVCTSYFAT